MNKKKIIIKGHKVKDVGYRPFLFEVATRKLVPCFDAVNKKEVDKDGNEIVEVFVGGPEDDVDNFIEFIKDENNKPEYANVESIEVVEKDYKGGIMTIESFSRCLSVHQLAKFATIGNKIVVGQEMLRIETNQNFKDMDLKYKLISDGMFALVDAIEKRQQSFDMHLEKIDKNIETLLEILVKNK